jgi:hypothetical protein
MIVLKKDTVLLKKILTVSFLLRVVMILSLFLALWKKDYAWVVGTSIALFISFLPTLMNKDITITLPWIFDFLIALILILHVGGRLLDYYIIIPGYEIITRFFISFLVAFVSFTLIYILDEYWDGLKMDKTAMAFVVVISTMSIGVILEFVKWLNITGTLYIKTNHVLMLNLTADTIVGIIIATVGYIFIKSGEFDELTRDFGKQINERLIKKQEKR